MTDTPKKRSSALNVGIGNNIPLPDGSIDAGDLAQLAGAYRGFLDGAAAELASEMGDMIVYVRPRNLTLDVRPASGGLH